MEASAKARAVAVAGTNKRGGEVALEGAHARAEVGEALGERPRPCVLSDNDEDEERSRIYFNPRDPVNCY